MPRWLPRVLRQIRLLAEAGRVRFTLKAGGQVDHEQAEEDAD
jgi:hypothetical protein